MIDHVNVPWTKEDGHSLDLIEEECELRFNKNFTCDPVAMTKTIKDFYNYYLERPDKHLVLVDSKMKLPKGSYLVLELFIRDDKYKARVNEGNHYGSDDGISYVASSKPKRPRSERYSDSVVVKRTRAGQSAQVGPLVSTFQSDRAFTWTTKPTTPACHAVEFTMVNCTIDEETGNPSLTETNHTERGSLAKTSLVLSARDSGRSKDVFQLTIPAMGGKYVAKAFKPAFAKTEGGLDNNLVFLLQELVRIKRLEMFHRAFVEEARHGHIEIADISVSDSFIICLKEEPDQMASNYLVEPLRASTSVIKFSGTFGSSLQRDKRSATVLALAHFILVKTACKLGFADLQGSIDFKPGEVQRLVLFDPMTHSPFRATGPGDFGIEGIEDFIQTHICTIVCKKMGLASKEVLTQTLKLRLEEVEQAQELGEDLQKAGGDDLTIVRPPSGDRIQAEDDSDVDDDVPNGGAADTAQDVGKDKTGAGKDQSASAKKNLTPYEPTDSD